MIEKKYDISFLNEENINKILENAKLKSNSEEEINRILEKARLCEGITPEEAAILLSVNDEEILNKMFKIAKEVKERIYGKRIVMFAPLYVSNYCVNNCKYCGYQHCNEDLTRKKLTREELVEEVKALEKLGHKRIVLEAGEDPINCSIDYILDCIKDIYSIKFENGNIRRININIAATTVENYKKLKEAEIGTYTLFQESFHEKTYDKMHLSGPKKNYYYHTTAMFRAREAGIDDVGIGVLYGLYDHKYETVAMIMYANELEKVTGVGPHTISVPRLREASNVTLEEYPYLVNDYEFKKIVAVLRLAVPYTGMILSTREESKFRDSVIELGISQVSAGSCTGVGGYSESTENTAQFEVGDHRSPMEMLESLMKSGYIPSYCTACYRSGRTGDRFMEIAKSGKINIMCEANAMMTLKEFLLDYADENLRKIGDETILKELEKVKDEKFKEKIKGYLKDIENGARDISV
ncbi:MAG: [FeFe] hydrogenase H-cluster radical SAM maturase HydG [Fusobacterium perfoetens]|uniref:[FeFe] hydrogenase H-cluster radical SAM maturase HydG n=1 Tax=Fusobacterium perfoetens TaxID=852 RepID=UPI0023F1A7D3|nr:[FeFe] hydrogenase H-cluster radical SAM maturase HydG [Fusobacterium perfoetens]MCI6152423.1 [FeFe] hydrogenase H-cluster radical SAM maturase HydG [Fusobacterium perfoetens]MDY3237022.1 [FeFe] hydrogenase H-cluster radical SAM maturase HydG [Fusobacterium perfoetens]